VLAQFVLIVFAMFAVLSLVIDMGYARLTQAQMQNAADTAALEGMRKRDVGVLDPATGQTVDDPFASDCLRRAAANRLVHWVFDDDFNLTNGDPDYQFGAGPIIDVTDGVTNLHGLALLSVSDSPVYKPDLQLNQQNQVYGDMVSGRFCYNPDPAASENSLYALEDLTVCTEPQRADGPYARNDFNPSPTVPQPPADLPGCPPPDEPPPDPWPLPGSGSLTGVDDSAFLVRLRRSNELQDFGGQTEPSVASSGPSLPLVFGRGTTIAGDDPSSSYSARRDGFTVRATAIAQVRPALHVGLPQTNPYQPGVTPFALRDTFVQTLNALGTAATINPANGVICAGAIPPVNIATCIATAPTAVGRFVDNLTDPSRTRWRTISTVGQALPATVPVACGSANSFAGYGPVYSPMSSGTNRIIGFTRIGLGQDRSTPARAANPCATVISRGVPLVAASNASASLVDGLPLPADAEPVDVTDLLDKNCPAPIPGCTAVGRVNYGPVLVPVLAR